MKETPASRLLSTTATDVLRHLENREYGAAAEELLTLKTPAAVAYVTAVICDGLHRPIAKAFIVELTVAVNDALAEVRS